MFQKNLLSRFTIMVSLLIATSLFGGCQKPSDSAQNSTPQASQAVNSDQATPTSSNTASSAESAAPNASMPITGADKDAKGCIASAGFIWCNKENQCVQPWEYAASVAIPNTEDSVGSYCGNK